MSSETRDVWGGVSLGAIWNWLPAFRAVAESEHLPTAAARLHVSAPALSRTVRLLEEHLEVELFNRVGRRLVLNSAGEQLLSAVQEAMGGLDRVLEEVQLEGVGGRLRVGSLGVLTNHFVLPAALTLSESHPQLRPMLENHRPKDANERLWRGELDVAFYYEGLSAPGVEVEELGRIGASVYCGQGHPLFERAAEVSDEEMLRWPFSVPQVGDSGQVMDGWPVDVTRRVGMQITLLTSNVEVCRSGSFVTVLPDVAARAWVERGELRRLGFEGISAIRIFGAVRVQEVGRSVAREMMEEVGRRVQEEGESGV